MVIGDSRNGTRSFVLFTQWLRLKKKPLTVGKTQNSQVFFFFKSYFLPYRGAPEAIVTGSEEAGSPSGSQDLVLAKGVCVSCNPRLRQPILSICS